jgi:hypothetical protein
MHRYSVPQSDPVIGINNMTLLDSPQTVVSNITGVSAPSSPQYEDRQYSSSLLGSYNKFNYSSLSSPNKRNIASSIYSINKEDDDSTESSLFSSPFYLSDETQLSYVHSSSTSEIPLLNTDVTKLNVTKVDTSSRTQSSSVAHRTSASHSEGQIADTALTESYDQITVSSRADTGINVADQTSLPHKNYTENISNLTSEEVIMLPVVTTDTPLTRIVQHLPANRADSYSSPDTSQITETTSYSSDTNGNSFSVNTTVGGSQAKNRTNYPQNEGRQHFIDSKTVSFQQLNYSALSEPKIETDNLMASNVSHHPSVSDATVSPLPTNSISKNNIKHISDEELQLISLSAYHPNDVIHVSSSELYAIDGSHNTSYEEKHPCARTCKEGAPPMVCKYRFELEWYYTMSKACYNCPLHLEDCSRKDCVVADGVRRPIIVVNRQMPGPSVEVSLSIQQ